MATLYSSLTNFWRLDEASGARADSVGSSTLTDNATVTSNTGLVYSTAAEFVIANSEYLSAADSAALSMGDIDFWIAAWVFFPAKAATQSLVSKWDVTGNKREYLINLSTTRFQFFVSHDGTVGTSVVAESWGTPVNNAWHLVIAWHNSVANTINISVNGGPVDSAAHTTGVLDDVTEFRIGSIISAAPAYFGGRMGPVIIGKDYIPTAADITYLYDSGTGITLAEMAIGAGRQALNFRNLGDSGTPDINSATDATLYDTLSWTLPTIGMVLVAVHGARAGADVPTMSGNSVTWTQIASTYWISNRSISWFATNVAGATTGVTRVDWGANTETGCIASFFHVTGVDLRGGVAAAIVQTATATGTATSGSVTLAAASNPNNRPIAAFYHSANEVKTPRADWTEIDDLAGSAHVRNLQTQWRSDAFETTASASWVTSALWLGFAAEIKALLVGPPIRVNPLRVWTKWR